MMVARLRRLIAVGTALVLAGCATPPPPAPVDTSPVEPADRGSTLPEGWHHGAFMEIFVRAYQDSDGDGNGDLRGLASRLDYLQDLGIRGLWLMPVTRSADRDHGYATTDFRALEPDYGTLADFDELLRQAHARGIGVIIDYVVNHASAEHPMFVAARQGPRAPFRDWFVWADAAPLGWDIWGKDPWYHTASAPWHWRGEVRDLPRPPAGARGFYFGTFGPHMPDFDLRQPHVLRYHEDSLRWWLNRGLDGFRLDAVPHLVENDAVRWNDQPESRQLTRRLQDLIRSYDKRWVVCEATAEPVAYADPAVCGASFAFGHVKHYVKAALGDAASVHAVATYFLQAPPALATFVSNHDLFAGRRLWDQVGGDVARYQLAAAAYLLQPGTPFVYYGEEVGQPGVPGLPGDRTLRAPMSWAPDPETGGFTRGRPFRPIAPRIEANNVQAQLRDPGSIHAFYKAMIGLRNRYPSIARGSYEAAHARGLAATWQRRWQGEHTLVAINYDTRAAALPVQLPPGAALRRAWPHDAAERVAAGRAGEGRVADPRGEAVLELPAQSVQVFEVHAR